MRAVWLWAVGCLAAVLLLLAVALVVVQRARHSWNQVICANQLHTLGHAMSIYLYDYNDRLPPTTMHFARYVCHGVHGLDYDLVHPGASLFHCPLDANPPQLLAITNDRLDGPESCRGSYDCRLSYPPLPRKLGNEPLMWDIDGGNANSPRANHRHGNRSYGNVLYREGHVEAVPWREWPTPNQPPHGGQL